MFLSRTWSHDPLLGFSQSILIHSGNPSTSSWPLWQRPVGNIHLDGLRVAGARGSTASTWKGYHARRHWNGEDEGTYCHVDLLSELWWLVNMMIYEFKVSTQSTRWVNDDDFLQNHLVLKEMPPIKNHMRTQIDVKRIWSMQMCMWRHLPLPRDDINAPAVPSSATMCDWLKVIDPHQWMIKDWTWLTMTSPFVSFVPNFWAAQNDQNVKRGCKPSELMVKPMS